MVGRVVPAEYMLVQMEGSPARGVLVKIRRRGTFTRPPRVTGQIRAVETRLLGYLQTDFVTASGQEEVANRAIGGLMLQGAVAEAAASGFQLVVQHSPSIQWRQAAQTCSEDRRLRGLICASYYDEKVLRRVASTGLPTVLLDENSNVPRVHSVRDDSFEGARQAIQHLAQLGHRRIAYAHWDRPDMNRTRPLGYRKGLRDAGLPRRRGWEILTELTESGARAIIDRLLALTPAPTALYCFNNTLANFAIAELRRRGLRVPDDLSVVGAGGEEVPGLTCHQVDWYLMGRTAVQTLLRAMAAPDRSEAEHHLCPHTFYAGQTAAPGS